MLSSLCTTTISIFHFHSILPPHLLPSSTNIFKLHQLFIPKICFLEVESSLRTYTKTSCVCATWDTGRISKLSKSEREFEFEWIESSEQSGEVKLKVFFIFPPTLSSRPLYSLLHNFTTSPERERASTDVRVSAASVHRKTERKKSAKWIFRIFTFEFNFRTLS